MSENILMSLAERARRITEEKEKERPLSKLISEIQPPEKPFRFERALAAEHDISFICELKKASPSKGLISRDFNYPEILKAYERAGATAISCLTEPTKFLGSLEILKDVTGLTNLPVLRKDFIVTPYQIYEAAQAGASAFLLIAKLLSEEDLAEYLSLADDLSLSVLLEVHDQEDLKKALKTEARVIGINNRNLENFQVDLGTTENLIEWISKDRIIISESGIHTADDVNYLKSLGVDGLLIGEQLMRAEDPVEELKGLRGEA